MPSDKIFTLTLVLNSNQTPNKNRSIMLKLSLKFIITLACTCFALSSNASWYTANGQGSNQNEAVNDALENIMLQAGADIKLLQTYEDGKLINDSYQLKSRNPIKNVKVIEAQHSYQKVNVTIKAFVDDEKLTKRCQNSSLFKTFSPISFKFKDSSAYQSSVGIEGIQKELNKLVYDKLATSKGFVVRPIIDANVINTPSGEVNEQQKMQALKILGARSNSQFIIVGTINSVALSDVGTNFFSKLMYLPTRTINYDLDIYDVIDQTLVFHQNYEADTDWAFDRGEYLDLRSSRFTSSDYGLKIYELAARSVKDILYELECQKVSAKVIDTDEDEIIINIGRDSNVQVGQRFSLFLHSVKNSYEGSEYETYDKTTGVYKVVAVYPNTARLHPEDLQNNPLNVKAGDIVYVK